MRLARATHAQEPQEAARFSPPMLCSSSVLATRPSTPGPVTSAPTDAGNGAVRSKLEGVQLISIVAADAAVLGACYGI